MIISQENLEKAGYKRYLNTINKQQHNYLESYEKRFDAERGKKYFIHIDCWDMQEFIPSRKGLDFSPKAQFITDKDETFNVEYFAREDTTIEKMEAFFEKIWNSMNCQYYEEWEN
jgi:hypothetical protein